MKTKVTVRTAPMHFRDFMDMYNYTLVVNIIESNILDEPSTEVSIENEAGVQAKMNIIYKGVQKTPWVSCMSNEYPHTTRAIAELTKKISGGVIFFDPSKQIRVPPLRAWVGPLTPSELGEGCEC